MCAIIAETGIATPRLRLRAPRATDAGWIAERINDYGIASMLGSVPHPYGFQNAEGFLERLAAADASREQALVIERRNGGPIGIVDLKEQPIAWSPTGTALSPEIGYWLDREAWGRGFASEAVQAALSWAQTAWGVRAASAGHFADNPASGRVLEKAGFLYTGEVQHRPSRARGCSVPCRMMVWLA